MPNLLRKSTPVARKVHYCRCCGAPAVQPGDKYTRETWVYDGRVYDWVSCSECDSIHNLVWAWVWDYDGGIGREEYEQWANETADDPEHGEAAKAYLVRAANQTIEGE